MQRGAAETNMDAQWYNRPRQPMLTKRLRVSLTDKDTYEWPSMYIAISTMHVPTLPITWGFEIHINQRLSEPPDMNLTKNVNPCSLPPQIKSPT